MTQVANPPSAAPAPEPEPVPEGHVRLTIDGISTIAPKGELVIRTAERIGIAIPRFCDHPLLDPAGACRQCLVEVTDMGNGRGMPKPAASDSVSRSSNVPLPDTTRRRICTSQPVPSRQGVHLPQDSCL